MPYYLAARNYGASEDHNSEHQRGIPVDEEENGCLRALPYPKQKDLAIQRYQIVPSNESCPE